jgi:hypothetical protein
VAALVTHVVPQVGLQLDAQLVLATSGGDDCQAGPGVLLVVKNADSASHTVTLVTPQLVDGDLVVADRPVPVAAGKTGLIPVSNTYRNPSTGRASLTYDAVTAVSVAVIRMATS